MARTLAICMLKKIDYGWADRILVVDLLMMDASVELYELVK